MKPISSIFRSLLLLLVFNITSWAVIDTPPYPYQKTKPDTLTKTILDSLPSNFIWQEIIERNRLPQRNPLASPLQHIIIDSTIEASIKVNTGRFLRTYYWFDIRDYGYNQYTQIPYFLGTPTAVLLDGRPLTSEIDPEFNLLQIPIYSLKQIEINPYPTPIHPTGGTLNFVSKTLTDSIPFAQATMMQGGEKYQQYRFTFNMILLPRLALLLNAGYVDNRNYRENPYKYTASSYDVQLQYYLSKQWRLRVLHRTFNDRQKFTKTVYRRDYDFHLEGNFSENNRLKLTLYHTDLQGGGQQEFSGYRFSQTVPFFANQTLTIDAHSLWKTWRRESIEYDNSQRYALTDHLRFSKSIRGKVGAYYHHPAVTEDEARGERIGGLAGIDLELPADVTGSFTLSYENQPDRLSQRPVWIAAGGIIWKNYRLDYAERHDPQQNALIRTMGGQVQYHLWSKLSTKWGYQYNYSENTTTNWYYSGVPEQRMVGEINYRDHFYGDDLKVHGRFDGEYTSRRYIEPAASYRVGQYFMMNFSLKIQIYDFVVAYELNNLTNTKYVHVFGYELPPRHYRLLFQLDFWN